jgi:hypothetical protein
LAQHHGGKSRRGRSSSPAQQSQSGRIADFDLTDRVEAYNLKADAPVRIVKIAAFGAINGTHEKIQDIDLGVQIEPRGEGPISKADQDAAFEEIRGRSAALKLHPVDGLLEMRGRAVWEA